MMPKKIFLFTSSYLIYFFITTTFQTQNLTKVACDDFPESDCLPGSWPQSDKNIGKAWVPGRHTHYGSTSGGACGYGDIVNCPQNGKDCSSYPADLLKAPYAGMYAAP